MVDDAGGQCCCKKYAATLYLPTPAVADAWLRDQWHL